MNQPVAASKPETSPSKAEPDQLIQALMATESLLYLLNI